MVIGKAVRKRGPTRVPPGIQGLTKHTLLHRHLGLGLLTQAAPSSFGVCVRVFVSTYVWSTCIRSSVDTICIHIPILLKHGSPPVCLRLASAADDVHTGSLPPVRGTMASGEREGCERYVGVVKEKSTKRATYRKSSELFFFSSLPLTRSRNTGLWSQPPFFLQTSPLVAPSPTSLALAPSRLFFCFFPCVSTLHPLRTSFLCSFEPPWQLCNEDVG